MIYTCVYKLVGKYSELAQVWDIWNYLSDSFVDIPLVGDWALQKKITSQSIEKQRSDWDNFTISKIVLAL